MTSHYVYAIIPNGSSLPNDVTGIFDEVLTLVAVRDLAAVASERGAAPQPSAELVARQHVLVTRLREVTPALPVRFGTVRDGDQLRDEIEIQYETLTSDIQRLADKVEFGITVLWDAPPGQPAEEMMSASERPASGTEYMQRRFAEYQRENADNEAAERIRSAIEPSVEHLADELVSNVMSKPDIPYRGSFLVRCDTVDAFQQEFDATCKSIDGVQILLVGPWPPYSFVTRRESGLAGMLGAIST